MRLRYCWICIIALSFIPRFSSGVQAQPAQSSARQSLSFSISISAPQSAIKLSSNVTIKVTVTNVSTYELFAPDLAFDVRDSTGKPVARVRRKPGVPPGGSFMSVPLKPGQSYVSSINLKKHFVFTMPGKYTVQAWREDYVRGTNRVRGRVKSNTITLDIVD